MITQAGNPGHARVTGTIARGKSAHTTSNPRPAKPPKPRSAGDFESWSARAACRNYDPEMFFPPGNTGIARLLADEAKAVCHGCPVMGACKAWAMANPSMTQFGIWGGATEDERFAERRKLMRSRPRTGAGA